MCVNLSFLSVLLLLCSLLCFFFFFFFFFSSRRRHTRCLSDWSSDVCSSDLDRMRKHNLLGIRGAYDRKRIRMLSSSLIRHPFSTVTILPRDGRIGMSLFIDTSWRLLSTRSEERRVGKSVDLGGRSIIKIRIR